MVDPEPRPALTGVELFVMSPELQEMGKDLSHADLW
jgi:hypothetical protein